MTNKNDRKVVPQTVLQVIDQFAAVMRADPDIPNGAISRLETLLRKGVVPKPDDINAVLFEAPMEVEK